MSGVRLSVCIPTHNFGDFIGVTLESILGQASGEVEVVVGDGASTDNTAEVVRRYQPHFAHLTYRNFGKRGGVDLDLSKTIALAQGDYCWLMSSDDVLRPGAIQRVLDEIRLGHDVYLINRTMCDRDLKPLRRKSVWLSRDVTDSVYRLSNKSELMIYLNASKSIGALFSYISSIVVSRNKWNGVGGDERFAGTCYAHVGRIFSLLKLDGCTLKYINESLVLCRGGNDSFLTKGLASRFRLDFDGYRLLGECLFCDEEIRKSFTAVVRRQHKWYTLARLKSEVDRDHNWKELQEMLADYGYGSGELLLVNILGSSKLSVRLLRSFKALLRI